MILLLVTVNSLIILKNFLSGDKYFLATESSMGSIIICYRQLNPSHKTHFFLIYQSSLVNYLYEGLRDAKLSKGNP